MLGQPDPVGRAPEAILLASHGCRGIGRSTTSFTRSFQAPRSRSTLSGCSTWVESKLRRSQPRSRIRPTSSTDGLSTDARAGVAFWTSGTGIDGENPVEIDELDLIPIDPLPSHVRYQDMADFADGISDAAAARQSAHDEVDPVVSCGEVA
jgi:hypothetical protein